MTEAADLRVKVSSDGVPKTIAEMHALDAAVGDVGDTLGDGDSSLAGEAAEAGSAMDKLAMAARVAAVGGIAILVVEAVPAIAALGALIVGLTGAAVGMVALGGAAFYMASEAMKAATHTKTLAEAWEKMTKVGTPMGDALKSLADTAAELGKPFIHFIERIGPAVIGSFEYIITILSKSLGPILKVMSRETLRWLSVLRELAEKVLPYLPRFIKNFSDAMMPLADSMIRLMGPALKSFIAFLGPFVKGLVALANPMKNVMVPIFRAFGEGLRDLGKAIGMAGKALAPSLVVLFQQLGNIFIALGKGLKALAPVMGPLLEYVGTALTGVLKVVTPLIKAFAPFLKFVFEAMTKHLEMLVPILVEVANILGKGLLQVFKVLEPVAKRLVNVLVDLFEKVLKAILPILPPLVKAFVSLVKAVAPLIGVFARIIKKLTPVIVLIAKLLTAILTGKWEKAGRLFGKLWDKLVDLAKQAWDWIWGWLKELPGKFFNWLVTKGIPALIKFGGKLVGAIWKGIAGAAAWFAGMVAGFLDKYVFGPIQGALSWLDGMVNGGALQDAVDVATGLVNEAARVSGSIRGDTVISRPGGGGPRRQRRNRNDRVTIENNTTLQLDTDTVARHKHRREVLLGKMD